MNISNYRNHFSLGFIFLFVSIISFSQTRFTVSGIVKDSTSKPLGFATVGLYKPNLLEQPIKSTYTNDKGRFSFANVDTGSYTLVITHTGFIEKQQSITLNQNLQVEDIQLFSSAGNLQGVTVSAKKPLIEQSDDKVIFNVENDPATKTETAIDILRKTPFVSVDGDNNIQVNGQSNFRVLLNGRETAMFAQNVKEALKSFPGALITKIEVITSPSAKYDAEGVGGVINIITKKKVAGYNGSINTHYNINTGWMNLNTNFSAKFGKLGVTLNYGAGGVNAQRGKVREETIALVNTRFKSRLIQGETQFTNFWNFGNTELSYEIDTLNTVSLYGNISGGRNKGINDQTITTKYESGPDTVSLFDLNTLNEYPTKSVGADYIRKFAGVKDKEFSLRFNGEFGKSNTFLNSIQDNPVTPDRYIVNNSEAINKQYTIQSDFIQPLKKDRKIEAGVKAILRRATSDFESLIKSNSAEDYKMNLSNTDYFKYDQDVYSAYGTYSIKVKKTTFRIGARMEHTEVDGNFISSKTNVRQSYTTWLPNLQATRKMSNTYTVVTTYSVRMQRPFIWNLNPFINNNDSFNVSYGNPNLDPQTIHSLSIQNRFSKGTTFMGLTLTGSYSDNMIVRYSTFDSNSGVTYTTSENIGKEIQISLNGNISTKITPEWNVFLNGNVRYNRVENINDPTQSNSGIGGNANLNTSYNFNKRLVASSYAGFWRGPVTIQTKYPLNIWYGVSIGYKFFKEKLTTSFGAANFLEEYRDFAVVTRSKQFNTTRTSTMPFRGLSISLNWNFGKLTENVSKKKGVNNDDLIGNGGSNN